MSVIAYRNGIIAADRQATIGGMKHLHEKISITGPMLSIVVAATGACDSEIAMRKWFDGGADPAKFPDCQKGDDWARLIIVRPPDDSASMPTVSVIERSPYEIPIYAEYLAWGLGAEYAMTAMDYGLHARQAVRLANKRSIYCGFGVHSFQYDPHGAWLESIEDGE